VVNREGERRRTKNPKNSQPGLERVRRSSFIHGIVWEQSSKTAVF
jgi:hypothetical protein